MSDGGVARLQDSVHGLMEFRGANTIVPELLDTRELQRLRNVSQTGLGRLVYPTADHSRFAHSLGTAFLATKFGNRLREQARGHLAPGLRADDLAVRDLAVAALCHDLGHGPLSHLWERAVMGRDFDRSKWIAAYGLQGDADDLAHSSWHEIVTQALLAWPDGELHRVLERMEAGAAERIRAMLRGRYGLEYLPRLLSSDVDIDRADYLLRDAYATGVAYGRYDVDWLISTCGVGHTDSGRLVVGYDRRKGFRVVEQFLVARRALYETVYYHKTVRAAEGLLELFVQRLRSLPHDELMAATDPMFRPLVRVLSGQTCSLRELLTLDDSLLWVYLRWLKNQEMIDWTLRDLGRRIVDRDLFKLVTDENGAIDKLLERDGRDRIRGAIRPFVTGDPDYYFHPDTLDYHHLIDRPTSRSYFIDDDHKATPMWEDRELNPFAERSWSDQVSSRKMLFCVREAVPAVRELLQSWSRPATIMPPSA